MRRNLHNASAGSMQQDSSQYALNPEKCAETRRELHHDVVSMDRWRSRASRPSNSGDEGVPSNFLSQDEQVSEILREVDAISKSLQSDNSDYQTLSRALERTVLCALKQSLLDRELRSLALTDDLTGLYNRRAFFTLAAQQLKVGRRNGQGFLLFFADVDNLKDINDCYGHREGDLALICAANALTQTFRHSDIIGRLGGDEFAVLALEATSQDEESIVSRLGQNLSGSAASETRYQLSLSVGVARFDPKRSLSLDGLLAEADLAMYKQKRTRPRFLATRS